MADLNVAMHHAALAALPNMMGSAMSRKPQPNPKHERTTGGSAFYQIYETSDGRHLVLGAQELKFVRTLLGKLGRPDLVPLCERGPGSHQAPVIAFLQGVFRGKSLAGWRAWFEGLDVSFTPSTLFAKPSTMPTSAPAVSSSRTASAASTSPLSSASSTSPPSRGCVSRC